MKLKKVFNEPSWLLQTKQVRAAVTRRGGNVGPVWFNRHRRAIQPYHVAPWWNEKLPAGTPPTLKVLRGDFFCAPFGHNTRAFRGEQHPLHGETANRAWAFVNHRRTKTGACLHLRMATRIRPGTVDKRVALVVGHNILYQQHILSGMKGPMPVAHHPTLKFPDRPESGRIALSPFLIGATSPTPMGDPGQGLYPFLKNGATFRDLRRVPTIWGTHADLSVYPNYPGFMDLVLMVADPKLKFGWSSVTFPKEGYAWFSLRDPQVLKATVFWQSNGGVWPAPWNGRHANTLGIEDVSWWFGDHIGDCLKDNPMSRRGIKPYLTLYPRRPTVINYIQGCVPVPRGFACVRAIEIISKDELVLHGEAGKSVRVPCATSFILSGQLADMIERD